MHPILLYEYVHNLIFIRPIFYWVQYLHNDTNSTTHKHYFFYTICDCICSLWMLRINVLFSIHILITCVTLLVYMFQYFCIRMRIRKYMSVWVCICVGAMSYWLSVVLQYIKVPFFLLLHVWSFFHLYCWSLIEIELKATRMLHTKNLCLGKVYWLVAGVGVS